MRLKNLILIIPFLIVVKAQREESTWRWECIEGKCIKQRMGNDISTAQCLAACRLSCNKYSLVWPQPTGEFTMGTELRDVQSKNIEVRGIKKGSLIDPLIGAAMSRFKNLVSDNDDEIKEIEGKIMIVQFNISNQNEQQLTLDTDESYTLNVQENEGNIEVKISAENFFGARHALETLSQLVFFDDIHRKLRVPIGVHITDKPVYRYRGILLDTGRNYISIASIKRTLDGMAATKLNTFHWHITDSQSFPYVSTTYPQLSKLGAYSPKQVYTPKMIEQVISYARERGIRVLPEFDAPAHVGEGWQETGLLACFNKQPWNKYCVEPPCGQFDPTQWKLYDMLEGLYKDMITQFKPDIFHMGGDEVDFRCWNTTDSIVEWMSSQNMNRTTKGFVKLWNRFQTNALQRLDKVAGTKLPIIMWSSTLTQADYVEENLPKDRYIIQMWTTLNDQKIMDLLQLGYRLIISNYDALYLDCGFAGWVTGGLNWCAPYKGWQTVYDNDISNLGGERKNQILGSEATLWTEQSDDTSIDSRIWPRTAALAERLWSDPSTKWRDAEYRMLTIRERLVKMGIAADSLEPLWCSQNEGSCPS